MILGAPWTLISVGLPHPESLFMLEQAECGLGRWRAGPKFLPESFSPWLFSAGNNPHTRETFWSGELCSPTAPGWCVTFVTCLGTPLLLPPWEKTFPKKRIGQGKVRSTGKLWKGVLFECMWCPWSCHEPCGWYAGLLSCCHQRPHHLRVYPAWEGQRGQGPFVRTWNTMGTCIHKC